MKGLQGKIQVTIQREDRLETINILAETVKLLAKCLNQSPEVTISQNTLYGDGDSPVIGVDFADEVDRTEILLLDQEKKK